MKKNHLALIFLTVITMVAVWYLKSPTNNSGDDTGEVLDAAVSSRLDVITSMREAVREERSLAVAALDAVIASDESSVTQKASALSEKQVISDLTEKEVVLEVQIINLGYQDAFVHCTSSGVEVVVVSNDNSGSSALDIINMVYSSFDNTDNVVVNFQTVEELTKA